MTRQTDPDVHARSRRFLLSTLAAVTLVVGMGWSGAGIAGALPGGVDGVTAGTSPAAGDTPGLTHDTAAGEKLKGLFRVTAGSCADGAGKLSADLRAFAAAYQGQHFNQGAPKPDGSTPGATTLASGTYTPATKAFSLQWASP